MAKNHDGRNILLKIPFPLLFPLDEVVRTEGYSSRSHALIEAIRLFLDQRPTIRIPTPKMDDSNMKSMPQPSVEHRV